MKISRLIIVPGLVATMMASACSGRLVYPDPPQTGLARTPEITQDRDTGMASMTVSVLIYNVAGLPWPAGCGKKSRDLDDRGERIPIACFRSGALKQIGDRLGEMRRRGSEPDIVMIQEAFISTAAEIPERGGYPNWVAGPGRKDLGAKYSERADEQFLADRRFLKAEKSGKLQSSGLILASNFPIVASYPHPFKQWECAGIDCLANKGLLVVELAIPGLPQPLALATTHYNARGASGVSNERALTAHNLQVAEVSEFLKSLDKPQLPFIWGGDLNMRHAPDRIRYFVERSGDKLNEVSSFCVDPSNDCEVRIQWETDTPWYETQDLQGWASGEQVRIEPLHVEALFDEPVDGRMLSDHNGLLVVYRLTWGDNGIDAF